MGFVSMPFIPKLSGTSLATSEGSTSNAVVGGVYFHKTSDNRWSTLRCYVAGASVAIGVGLVRASSAASVNILTTALTADKNSYRLRGIAAAAVSNTGHISFCYVGGYCPTIQVNSAVASGVMLGLSGSNAGWFGSHTVAGSVIALGSAPYFLPIVSHDVTDSSAGSTSSGTIMVQLW